MVLVSHLKNEFHLYVFPGVSVFAWKVAGGYCLCAAAVLPKPTGAGILTITQICLVLSISQAEQFNHFKSIEAFLSLTLSQPFQPTGFSGKYRISVHVRAQIRLDSAAAAAALVWNDHLHDEVFSSQPISTNPDEWSEAEDQDMFFSLEFTNQESHLIRF